MVVGGQYHVPAALHPGKTRYPLYKRLGGPQGRSGRVRKILPLPGFDPRTVQPVAIRYTTQQRRYYTFCSVKDSLCLRHRLQSNCVNPCLPNDTHCEVHRPGWSAWSTFQSYRNLIPWPYSSWSTPWTRQYLTPQRSTGRRPDAHVTAVCTARCLFMRYFSKSSCFPRLLVGVHVEVLRCYMMIIVRFKPRRVSPSDRVRSGRRYWQGLKTSLTCSSKASRFYGLVSRNCCHMRQYFCGV